MARKKTRRKPKLNDVHRAFIVSELACYATPAQAAEALNEQFGVSVSAQATERYDPTKKMGQKIAQRWRDLFEALRADFLANLRDHIPEANKAVRVKKLARAANAMEARKNYVGMADMLERISKEVGNVYTNRREHTGKDGGPIRYREIEDMTDEQLDQELDEYVVEGLEAMKAAGKDVHPAKETEQ